MQLINASSMTPAVNDWLTNSHHLRILHVFDHACNLINEHKDVLSIITPQIGNGPFNLVVEDTVWFSDHIQVESPVRVLGNKLTLNDLIIDTDKAIIWNPCPDWDRLHGQRNNILKQSVPLPLDGFQPSLPAALLSALTNFIVTANVSASLAITRQLAGLGMGLTPSGDDFLMGALYAAWIIHPRKIVSILAKKIAETAAPLTTAISAAWLRSAGRGEASVLWHQLFDGLITGGDVELPIAKILSIGETSGADALSGFLGVMSACKELIIDECPS